MAEGLLGALKGDRWEAYSAGAAPPGVHSIDLNGGL